MKTKFKKCKCWICSGMIQKILKKLKGKERKFFTDVVNNCINFEDEAYYWKMTAEVGWPAEKGEK